MNLDDVAAMYDPTSPQKDFDYWLIQFETDVISKFLIGEKVIELGCARGNVTEKLAQRCQKLIVVEGAELNCSIASNRLKGHSNVEFHHSLWQDFDYAAADISDIVFSSGLQYLDHKNALFVLRKVRSFLRPQGRLHVVVPNARSLHRRIALSMNLIQDLHELSERDKVFAHVRVYDKELLFNELKVCGFDVLDSEGIFLKPFPNDLMMSLNESIIHGLYEVGKELPDYCALIYALCTK